MHVLVIDGEPVLRAAWKYLLSERGYEVSVAGTGEQGAEVCSRSVPDLVLVDVDALWPVSRGLSTIEVLRKDLPDVPILVLSSWLNRRKALESGANVCLPKPVDHATVLKLADMMVSRVSVRYQAATIAETPEHVYH